MEEKYSSARKKKSIRIIAVSVVFLLFVAATIILYTSPDYTIARDQLEYLNSDMGRFGVEVEESINELNGTNNDTQYRKWKQEVEDVERTIESMQIPCFICGGFAVLSLGGLVIACVKD